MCTGRFRDGVRQQWHRDFDHPARLADLDLGDYTIGDVHQWSACAWRGGGGYHDKLGKVL